MEKKVKIEIPSLPNFIRTKAFDQGTDRASIPIEDFTPDELRDLGKEWTEALIKHSEERRKLKANTP
jgi:hypothetical protein